MRNPLASLVPLGIRVTLTLTLLASLGTAQADTITSSASSMASQSSASLSDSISGSSTSSGGAKAQVAGPYTVTQLVLAADGRVRLQLAPAAGQPEPLVLTLPQAIVTAQALVPGAAVHLLDRSYGLAVARAADAEPYFLAIDDRLRRDFESVKL